MQPTSTLTSIVHLSAVTILSGIMSTNLPRVDLSGSPFEIGFEHGSLLAEQIASQLEIYEGIFQSQANLNWTEVLQVAQKFVPTIKRLSPSLFEEIEGIVAGVRTKVGHVDLLDIVALNARSEIGLGLLNDGCTSLAWTVNSPLRGETNGPSSHRQILAQNWDWTESVGKNLAIASVTQEGKPKIWMVIEPGIVGKIGYNSASVGVCLNAIRARPISTELLPIHLLLRIALECDSVAHAIATLEQLGGPASSQHILIADAASGSRGMEVSPRGSVYLKPDEHGFLAHTNHFLENRLVQEPPWLEGSPIRLARIRELCACLRDSIENSNGPDTAKLLRSQVFSDKAGSPQSICCYAPLGGRVMATLFNIVMQFERGREPYVEVVVGQPDMEDRGTILQLS